jgi:hypothetical protein
MLEITLLKQRWMIQETYHMLNQVRLIKFRLCITQRLNQEQKPWFLPGFQHQPFTKDLSSALGDDGTGVFIDGNTWWI